MTQENPGAEPVNWRSVWDLIKGTASRWDEIDAPRLGAALAFYTLFCITPLLLISITIAGFVFGREAAEGQIVWQIQNLVGYQGGKAIQALLAGAPHHQAAGITASGIGIAVLLWGASSLFGELRDSLNTVWGVKSSSSGGLMALIRYRFFSFAMVLGIGFLLLVSLVVSAAIAGAGKFFSRYLPTSELLLHIGSIVVSFVVVTVLFALLYKVVPDIYIEWRDVWIGGAVTALLFSVGKTLIGVYLGKASIGSEYGAAGSLVVFIIWVYYSAQVFFLGAEFTHSFAQRHGSRAHVQKRGPGVGGQGPGRGSSLRLRCL